MTDATVPVLFGKMLLRDYYHELNFIFLWESFSQCLNICVI